ncbi:MAG TPA: alkylmercury lyase [Thioalkalivibrio sp.]|nr:alkylmercury lyase [Thioalkalivibrio sp.]
MQQTPAQLRAAVHDALEYLRETFPLQQRIEAASPPVRSAYVQLLNSWRIDAAPPQSSTIDSARLAALVDLDAVVLQANGLGCYPFSADETPFQAHCADGAKVYAFCAIDTLAIPRLLGRRSRVEGHCASCGRALYCEVGENGGLPEQPLDHTAVVWGQSDLSRNGRPCCDRLCPNIQFMCATCAGWSDARVFTLPQAAVIANVFFSFQQHLTDPAGTAATAVSRQAKGTTTHE